MYPFQNPNMRCLMRACDACGVSYTVHDTIGNWISVHTSSGDMHFIRTKTSFNSSALDTIFRDKEYTYRLLHESLPMVETRMYLDPAGDPKWQQVRQHNSIEAITQDVMQRYKLPCVIKRNSGAQGDNVFLVETAKAVSDALRTIFDSTKKNYDHIALVQPYIEIMHEYRVLWFKETLLLAYEKITDEGKTVSMSPLANPGSRTRMISSDDAVIEQLRSFITQSPIARAFPYCGFDIAVDATGKMWLIEVNGWPGTTKFIRDHGDGPMIDVYKKIIQQL